MQGEGGVAVARHGVVRLLRQRVEGGVAQLARVYEGGVEQLELLLGDHTRPAPCHSIGLD